MGKIFTLLLIILLALASLIGYLVLTEKITAGKQQIADGEKQLEKGQQMLKEGKAKLANGKRELSRVKGVYRAVNDIPFIGIAHVLPVSGMVFKQATKQIAEGNMLIANGEVNVKIGEGRLEAGKLALSRGKERLNMADNIRIACAFGTVFFISLSIVLGFYWRRSLVSTFIHSKR